MHRFGRAAQLVSASAIPLAGTLFLNWSDATAIAFYWCETAIVVFFAALRLNAHRKATNKRGHFVEKLVAKSGRVEKRGVTTYTASFLTTAIAFGIGNLVFLSVLLGLFGDDVGGGRVEFPRLGSGLLVAVAAIAMGFAIDLNGIEEWPFVRVRRIAEAAVWRVFVLYLAIFIGLIGALVFRLPHAMFGVFFALRLFTDVASNFGQYDPDRPPRWMQWFTKDDAAFETEWSEEKRERLAREAEDEQPFDGRPSRTAKVSSIRVR